MNEQPDKNSSGLPLKIAVVVVAIVVGIFALTTLRANNGEQNDPTPTPSQQVTPTNTVSEEETTESDESFVVSYEGEEGRTALELLREQVQVVTQETSFGELVTSINGIESSDKYWIFYINGEMASVGADAYVTQDGDSIEWRYE